MTPDRFAELVSDPDLVPPLERDPIALDLYSLTRTVTGTPGRPMTITSRSTRRDTSLPAHPTRASRTGSRAMSTIQRPASGRAARTASMPASTNSPTT